MESTTVFLENVVGGGQHGGGVVVRTCHRNEGRAVMSESVQFAIRVAWFILSSSSVVETSRSYYFVLVSL